MKLVIVGGSFNPPHKAHKRIVRLLCQRFDKVIIVPCGIRPDKPSANIIDIKHRMEMVKIAFGGMKNVIIDFYDFENSTYTETYYLQERYEKIYGLDSLNHIGCLSYNSKNKNNAKIWHLIGQDIIKDIKNWEPNGEKIWYDLNYLIIVRPGYDMPKDLPPHSTILEIGDIIGSGTLVRKRIADNKSISDLVEPEIYEYIKANKLYRKDIMSKTKKSSKTEYEVDTLIGIFKNFKDNVFKYKYPEELFGELDGSSIDEKLYSLKKKFRKLMLDYGADRYNHHDNQELIDLSSEITRKILEFENSAELEINGGTYGEKRNINSFTINGKYEYQISSLESQADFSETYLGAYKDNKGNIENVCVKMAKITDDDGEIYGIDEIESNNDLICHEIEMLKQLDSIQDDAFQKVRRQHFPAMIDDFKVSTSDVDRYAFVTKHVPAYDFVTLKEKFPNGVPLYHTCWMLARMLSAAGHLHYQGKLHGNIHPPGLFANSKDHNVTMADLEFSIIDYTRNDAKYIGTTEYYTAPEVYKGAKPHPRTDIWSIGMSMIYILGGDIENRTLGKFEMIDIINQNEHERERGINGIRNLILSMVNQHPLARSDDAWRAYNQLSELRKLAFGEPRFVQFKF